MTGEDEQTPSSSPSADGAGAPGVLAGAETAGKLAASRRHFARRLENSAGRLRRLAAGLAGAGTTPGEGIKGS